MWLILLLGVVAGLCIGTVGVGGILLIPPLTFLADTSVHEASTTALFTFIFVGAAGTWLFHRRGSMDWPVCAPVCAGATVFSYLGAWAKSLVGAAALNGLIALATLFAGIYLLAPFGRRTDPALEAPSGKRLALLTGVGVLSGFGSGLTGAGGPLFSVPMMLLWGFAPLTAIGTGQVLQIVAASFGTLGNLNHGSIHVSLALWLAVGELAGVLVGVRLAHRVKAPVLRAMVASLCVVAGGWMFYKTYVLARG